MKIMKKTLFVLTVLPFYLMSSLFAQTKQYDQKTQPVEGISRVALGNKLGYIDQNGREIVTPKYDNGSDFENGFAKVLVQGKPKKTRNGAWLTKTTRWLYRSTTALSAKEYTKDCSG
jgi:hypothetical protein